MKIKLVSCFFILSIHFGYGQEKSALTDDLLGVFLDVGDWIQKLESKVNVIVDKEKGEQIKRNLNYLIQDLQDFRSQTGELENRIKIATNPENEYLLNVSQTHIKKMEKSLKNIGNRLTKLSTQLLDNHIDETVIQFVETLNNSRINRSDLIYALTEYLASKPTENDLEHLLCIIEQLNHSIDQSRRLCFQLLKTIK